MIGRRCDTARPCFDFLDAVMVQQDVQQILGQLLGVDGYPAGGGNLAL